MAKKLKDNIYFLSVVLSASVAAAIGLMVIKAPAVLLIAAPALILLLVLRLAKAARKDILEYLNGPARFCKGRGIEIGSGRNRMIRDSILVDMVDDFSSSSAYKVDYLADAHSLPKIESVSMDYVCASHVLEHLTDPIKAILEWLRILKPGGILWLRVPDKRKTFDRPRERTALSHLIQDFADRVPVDDPTHIDDSNRNTDPPRQQSHPYIHNHVWIPEDITELFNYINEKHAELRIMRLEENTCRNAQDFWVVVRKS